MRNSLSLEADFLCPFVLQLCIACIPGKNRIMTAVRKQSENGMNRGLRQSCGAPSDCSAQTHGFRKERNKVKHMTEKKDRQELTNEFLSSVSGGKVSKKGYKVLDEVIKSYKEDGLTRDQLIETIQYGWVYDCEFRDKYTDGTSNDYWDVIHYVEKHC